MLFRHSLLISNLSSDFRHPLTLTLSPTSWGRGNLLCQRLIDRGGEDGRIRRGARAKGAGDAAVAVEQVFVEVPFGRSILAQFAGNPFVERMRFGPDDVLLRGHGKIHGEPRLAEALDLLL